MTGGTITGNNAYYTGGVTTERPNAAVDLKSLDLVVNNTADD